MLIKIKFDSEDTDVREIFENKTARNLWCLWRMGHIVSQYFNDAVLEIAERIDALPFITVQSLIDSFQADRYFDFQDNDVASFVGEYVFYFSSPLEYPVLIQRVPK